jgi:transcriptional regulator with XRE-family HTH domain
MTGTECRLRRGELGLTLKQLSEMADISRTTLIHFENGKTKISARNEMKLFKFLFIDNDATKSGLIKSSPFEALGIK